MGLLEVGLLVVVLLVVALLGGPYASSQRVVLLVLDASCRGSVVKMVFVTRELGLGEVTHLLV